MNRSCNCRPRFSTYARHPRATVRVLTALAVVGVLSLAAPALATDCAAVDIHSAGWDRVHEITGDPGVAWWIEFGSELVLCAENSTLEKIGRTRSVSPVGGDIADAQMWFVRNFEALELDALGLRLAAGSPRFGLATAPDLGDDVPFQSVIPQHRGVFPVDPNTVLVRQSVNRPPREAARFSPEIQAFVDEVDGDRWMVDVTTLSGFNRYTHGPQIDQARDWLVNQFDAMPGLTVTTPSFWVQSTLAYNVMATLVGTTTPDQWYIIGGHYDSTSENPYVAAPGAEDNASGCAGVLEMARILTDHPPESTVLFVCYSGEEQYLYGSRAHVDELTASGDLSKVQGMLNMDMIGYTSDSDLDCLLETDPFAQSFLNLFADAAALYTSLSIYIDLWAGGSDHVPYLDAGVPAVLTIENEWYALPLVPQHERPAPVPHRGDGGGNHQDEHRRDGRSGWCVCGSRLLRWFRVRRYDSLDGDGALARRGRSRFRAVQ